MKVAFYKGRTRLFNRFVCWWLKGPYSHCELVLRTDAQGISDCLGSSLLDGGVRMKRMVLNPAHWDLVDVQGSIKAAEYWYVGHEHEGYDVLGLLGFGWRRQSGDKLKWFCSEAVAEMLGMQESWRFDPMVLWASLSKRGGL